MMRVARALLNYEYDQMATALTPAPGHAAELEMSHMPMSDEYKEHMMRAGGGNFHLGQKGSVYTKEANFPDPKYFDPGVTDNEDAGIAQALGLDSMFNSETLRFITDPLVEDYQLIKDATGYDIDLRALSVQKDATVSPDSKVIAWDYEIQRILGRDFMPTMTFVLILFMAYLLGNLMKKLRVPAVIGFILTGILCGPGGLDLGFFTMGNVQESALHKLLDPVCLGAIAASAGAELVVSEVRKSLKAISSIALSISITTMVLTSAVTFFTVHTILPAYDYQHVVFICILTSIIAAARSPASAMAVLRETRGDGPFCKLSLAVVVAKDILVFVTFAVAVEIMHLFHTDEGSLMAGHSAKIVGPLIHVCFSVITGCVGSIFAIKILSIKKKINPGLRALLLLTVVTFVYNFTEAMHAEPMLANVVLGLIVSNQPGLSSGHATAQKEEFLEVFGDMMPQINLLFFTLIGASVRITSIFSTLGIAFAVFVARLTAIILGTYFGYRIGKAPAEHQQVAWMAYVTQAGVALGLVKQVASRFPDFGPVFASFMVTQILMNMFTGPLLFKFAIFKMGEGRKAAPGLLAPQANPIDD